jgi:hypothetical protein
MKNLQPIYALNTLEQRRQEFKCCTLYHNAQVAWPDHSLKLFRVIQFLAIGTATWTRSKRRETSSLNEPTSCSRSSYASQSVTGHRCPVTPKEVCPKQLSSNAMEDAMRVIKRIKRLPTDVGFLGPHPFLPRVAVSC